MRRKAQYTVNVEVVKNPIPLDEALDKLAKAIARQMYQEEQQANKGVRVCRTHSEI